jgi:hypothetical protein
MPIALLTVLEWVGPDADHKEHDDPSWELVEDAIRRLNGRERNDLYLYADLDAAEPGAYLCVGGGGGRYVVAGLDRGDTSPRSPPGRATKANGSRCSWPVTWGPSPGTGSWTWTRRSGRRGRSTRPAGLAVGTCSGRSRRSEPCAAPERGGR